MFREVLVPFNGSDETIHALEIAGGLAAASDRSLRILAYSNASDVPIHSQSLLDWADSISTRYVLSPQITTISSPRFLGEELVAQSNRRPGSLLCLPSQGLGRKALVTGSLTTDVLSGTDAPVVLIGPDCEERIAEHSGPLVIALDGSPESERIVDVAHEWARDFGLAVEVITVIEEEQSASLAAAMARGDVTESSYVAHVARDSVLAEDDVTYEILHGKPVPEILREADLRDAAAIAIASHVPVGIDRLLHGSVLDEVVRHSPVPVIALNRNFDSPVVPDA